jgi:hypothetical protein
MSELDNNPSKAFLPPTTRTSDCAKGLPAPRRDEIGFAKALAGDNRAALLQQGNIKARKRSDCRLPGLPATLVKN